jgi:hypothetical protein
MKLLTFFFVFFVHEFYTIPLAFLIGSSSEVERLEPPVGVRTRDAILVFNIL